MTYLYSFIFVGLVSALGQLILDNTKLTPGHITSIFVVVGAFLDIFNIYDHIINFVASHKSLYIMVAPSQLSKRLRFSFCKSFIA